MKSFEKGGKGKESNSVLKCGKENRQDCQFPKCKEATLTDRNENLQMKMVENASFGSLHGEQHKAQLKALVQLN